MHTCLHNLVLLSLVFKQPPLPASSLSSFFLYLSLLPSGLVGPFSVQLFDILLTSLQDQV